MAVASPTITVDLSCLYTTVSNASGKARRFGFLPPHGRQLAIGEQFTIFGHIADAVSQFDRTTDRRNQEALAEALNSGALTIIQTPTPILEDKTSGDTKMIELDNGSLVVSDPCWDSAGSEIAA